MKCLLILLWTGVISAQIVNIPDEVFLSKLIGAGIDSNSNGSIEEPEALAVTVLNIGILPSDPVKIENLGGLEYFTNLTELRVNGHNLGMADFTSLSQLKMLYAYEAGLTSISVSGLDQLERLWIQYNALEAIDLTGLGSLKSFWCNDNEISALDLNDTQNLEVLVCGNNQIDALEVDFLSALGVLSCGYNGISSMDVANMASLQHLDMSGNPIEVIDITQTIVSEIFCNDCVDLKHVFAKNGIISYNGPDLLVYGMMFANTPSLDFICIDEGEQEALALSFYNPEYVTVSLTSCELSVDEFEESVSLMLVPNPVLHSTEIVSNHLFDVYRIVDMSGKLLFESSDQAAVQDHFAHLAGGLYFLKGDSKSGSSTVKFIKI